MKRDKKPIKGALLEALLELMLTFVCFGIGLGVLALCGVKPDADGTDFDLIVLLGILVGFAFFGIVFLIKKLIKGKRK